MYRRELNYWDLQQRGIGDVERYPISDALASLEGQQLLGSAFDELARRQQEFMMAEERGRQIRRISAESHMPINHVHYLDKTNPTLLGIDQEPPAPIQTDEPPPAAPSMKPPSLRSRATASETPASVLAASTGFDAAPVRRKDRSTEAQLIAAHVKSASSHASEKMALSLADSVSVHSAISGSASAHRDAVRDLSGTADNRPLGATPGHHGTMVETAAERPMVVTTENPPERREERQKIPIGALSSIIKDMGARGAQEAMEMAQKDGYLHGKRKIYHDPSGRG